VQLARGYVHILGGASGSGKTTITIQCVKKMQDHEPNWLGLHGSRIAWITGDRSDVQTIEKAESIGINIIEFYSYMSDPNLDGDKIIPLLKKGPYALFKNCIHRFKKDFDLLVVDPIGPFVDGDMNDYRHVLITLTPFNILAREKQITVLLLTHSPKGMGGHNAYARPQDNILGSNAFQGYCDTLHVLLDSPNDPTVKLYTRSHTAPEFTTRLVRTKDGWLSDDPMLFPTGSQNGDDPVAVIPSTKDIIRWIMDERNCSERTAYSDLRRIKKLLQPQIRLVPDK